ncbi:hypothetical protein BDF21DRAFT_320680, partial [Thamnidium elegans]
QYSTLGPEPFTQVTDHTRVDFTPLLFSLQLTLDPDCANRVHSETLRTKTYRQACSPPPPPPALLPPPLHPDTSVPWLEFWSLPISHVVRNIWYRFLHRKIPYRKLLNRFMPASFPTNLCAICSLSPDSLDHFLFSC